MEEGAEGPRACARGARETELEGRETPRVARGSIKIDLGHRPPASGSPICTIGRTAAP